MVRVQVFFDDIQQALSQAILGRFDPYPFVTYLIHLTVFLVFGPIAYLWALLIKIKRLALALELAVVVVSFVYGSLLIRHLEFVREFSRSAEFGIGIWWVLFAPAAPMLFLLLSFWDKAKLFLVPRNHEYAFRLEEERKMAKFSTDKSKASRKSQFEPIEERGKLNLGTHISGGDFPVETKIDRYDHRWIRLSESLLDQHIFVLGTTGAGKTVTLLRIIKETLANTDRRIYFIDGKGDLTTAGQVATLCHQYGRGQVPIFNLGQLKRGAVYDGFRGGAEDIYNRLAIMAGVQGAEANAQHYAERKKRILQLVTGVDYWNEVLGLGIEPPRDFVELVERIDDDWLNENYKGAPGIQGSIKLLSKQQDIVNLRVLMENLMSSFGHIITPEGFSLEGSHAAIFSLRTQSAGVDARSFLDFFVEDVKDWIGKRQPSGAKGLLIIDEFGTFGNRNIVNVLSLARSSGLGVVLATQTLASLIDEITSQQILDNCNTYVIMKSQDSEYMSARAGTKKAPEVGYQIEEGITTGVGTVRYQYQFKVHPDEVGKLTPGEAYLVNSKYAARIKIANVSDIAVQQEAVAPVIESKRRHKASEEEETRLDEAIVMPD